MAKESEEMMEALLDLPTASSLQSDVLKVCLMPACVCMPVSARLRDRDEWEGGERARWTSVYCIHVCVGGWVRNMRG
jgi:hypothetical protein